MEGATARAVSLLGDSQPCSCFLPGDPAVGMLAPRLWISELSMPYERGMQPGLRRRTAIVGR